MSSTNFSGPLFVGGVQVIPGFGLPLQGRTIFIWSGGSNGDGKTWASAFTSFANASSSIENNSTIYVQGDIREEWTAPDAIYGVRIFGTVGGRLRHVTEGDVVQAGNGVAWREPASGATSGGALITIHEHGWEVYFIQFQSKSDGTAVRLRRAESATWFDGSHSKVMFCRFIGAAATSKAIEDHGGLSHVEIAYNEFETYNNAISHTIGAGIDAPNRYWIHHNIFLFNTNHITLPCNYTRIEFNTFDAATTVVNTIGGTNGLNFITDNQFSDTTADYDIGHGYNTHATDIWRNWVTDGAALIVAKPAA